MPCALKFDASRVRSLSGGRAGPEQTLDVTQTSWTAACIQQQRTTGLFQHPSHQVLKDSRCMTPGRRDESRKFFVLGVRPKITKMYYCSILLLVSLSKLWKLQEMWVVGNGVYLKIGGGINYRNVHLLRSPYAVFSSVDITGFNKNNTV